LSVAFPRHHYFTVETFHLTVETFRHEAGSRHPKAQWRERIAPGRKSATAQPRHKKCVCRKP
jgi:hypothetical protein